MFQRPSGVILKRLLVASIDNT